MFILFFWMCEGDFVDCGCSVSLVSGPLWIVCLFDLVCLAYDFLWRLTLLFFSVGFEAFQYCLHATNFVVGTLATPII
jgi:hypothetical protein